MCIPMNCLTSTAPELLLTRFTQVLGHFCSAAKHCSSVSATKAGFESLPFFLNPTLLQFPVVIDHVHCSVCIVPSTQSLDPEER